MSSNINENQIREYFKSVKGIILCQKKLGIFRLDSNISRLSALADLSDKVNLSLKKEIEIFIAETIKGE